MNPDSLRLPPIQSPPWTKSTAGLAPGERCCKQHRLAAAVADALACTRAECRRRLAASGGGGARPGRRPTGRRGSAQGHGHQVATGTRWAADISYSSMLDSTKSLTSSTAPSSRWGPGRAS